MKKRGLNDGLVDLFVSIFTPWFSSVVSLPANQPGIDGGREEKGVEA